MAAALQATGAAREGEVKPLHAKQKRKLAVINMRSHEPPKRMVGAGLSGTRPSSPAKQSLSVDSPDSPDL